jgi:phage shock protein PspC (stress-responsive transcriptional regulator)
MTTGTHTRNPLANPPIPVQVTLAGAWTSLMFLYAYVDIYNFYKPGVVEGILAGLVFEFEVSATLLTTFVALLAVPALMVVLSLILPPTANRASNLVVASLYIPFSIFNAVGESWEWAAFYGLAIAIEVLLLVVILRKAWTWPRTVSAADAVAA